MNTEHRSPLRASELAAVTLRKKNLALFAQLGALNTDHNFWVDAAEAAHNGYADREIQKMKAKGEVVPDWLNAPFTRPQLDTQPTTVATQHPETKNMVKNISGMIALETGLSILNLEWQSAQEVLERILTGTSTPEEVLLFCQLAHMSWYADQPWLDRDSYPVINYFPNLTNEERVKDWGQIVDAARVLATKLHLALPTTSETAYQHGELSIQTLSTHAKTDPDATRLTELMRDKAQLLAFANSATKAYFNNSAAPGLTDEMATKAIHKNHTDPESMVADATYDMNILGFVALQEGLAILTSRTDETIRSVLDRILKNELSVREQRLLTRLAHATWLKGVFWRSMQHHKDVAMFEHISHIEQDKAWDQIVAAAQTLQEKLTTVDSSQAA